MISDSSVCTIEETYTVLQDYLFEVHYESHFPAINKNINFNDLEKYINQVAENDKRALPPIFLSSLHEELDFIVYVSGLSRFYIENSNGIFPYSHILSTPFKSKKNLQYLRQLLEKKQAIFKNNLQKFLTNIAKENKAAENLLEAYIYYLDTIVVSKVSALAEYASSFAGKIDFKKIKEEARKNSAYFIKLLEHYREKEEEEDKFFDALDTLDEDNFFDALSTLDPDHDLGSASELPSYVENIQGNNKKPSYTLLNWLKSFLSWIKDIFNKSQSADFIPTPLPTALTTVPLNMNDMNPYDEKLSIPNFSEPTSSYKKSTSQTISTNHTISKKNSPNTLLNNRYAHFPHTVNVSETMTPSKSQKMNCRASLSA